MEWKVTCKYDNIESVYTLSAHRYYDARVEGLYRFLEENRIPGRPWEYLTSKRGLIEVSAESLVDRRKEPRKPGLVEYYLEQIAKLRKLIRRESLGEDVKREAVGLLLKLEEVLGGKESNSS